MTIKMKKNSRIADHKDPRAPIVTAKEGEELDFREDIEARLVKAGRAEFVNRRRRRAAESGETDGGEGASGEAGAAGSQS